MATNPAVMGTMVFQTPGTTYNNAAFNGTSVSALIGANNNVSLTLGTTDGTTSTDSSCNGNFTGQFDQNNDGAEVSAAATALGGAASSAGMARQKVRRQTDPRMKEPRGLQGEAEGSPREATRFNTDA